MRECIMGCEECDYAIDECFEVDSDEDSLPCANNYDD